MGQSNTSDNKNLSFPKGSEAEKRQNLGINPNNPPNAVFQVKPLSNPLYGGIYGRYRRNLSITRTEATPLSPVVLSFDDPNSVNDNIFEKNFLENIEKEKNYGFLPIDVIHQILMFLSPKDLAHAASTCHLVHRIVDTNLFWKYYYLYYYDEMKRELKERGSIKIDNDAFNWKKQFFKRFNEAVSDSKYRSMYNPTKGKAEEDEEHSNVPTHHHFFNNRQSAFRFLLIGDEGVGCRSYLHQLVEGSFKENIEKRKVWVLKTSDSPNGMKQKMNPSHNPFGRKVSKNTTCRFEVFDTKTYSEDINSLNQLVKKMNILNINTNNAFVNQLNQSSGVFLCFSLDNEKSFQFLRQKNFANIVEKSMMRHEGKVKGKHRLPVIVCGFKSDIPLNERRVTREEVRVFVKQHNFKGYIECSAKNNCNVFLPTGILLDKVLEKSDHDFMMTHTEMLAEPPKMIQNFDPMMVTQRII